MQILFLLLFTILKLVFFKLFLLTRCTSRKDFIPFQHTMYEVCGIKCDRQAQINIDSWHLEKEHMYLTQSIKKHAVWQTDLEEYRIVVPRRRTQLSTSVNNKQGQLADTLTIIQIRSIQKQDTDTNSVNQDLLHVADWLRIISTHGT